MICTPIQIRFSDVDFFGHVNNASQQMFFDTGKMDYMRRVLSLENDGTGISLVMVRSCNNYLHQIRMHDSVEVESEVKALGTKSITLFQRIVNSSTREVLSDSESVLVAFDPKTQLSCEIPQRWRDAINGAG